MPNLVVIAKITAVEGWLCELKQKTVLSVLN